MQLTEEITTLKQKIAEAQELSAHHKREMDNNPNNFLFQLRYERFKDFVEQLEEELKEVGESMSDKQDDELDQELIRNMEIEFQDYIEKGNAGLTGLSKATEVIGADFLRLMKLTKEAAGNRHLPAFSFQRDLILKDTKKCFERYAIEIDNASKLVNDYFYKAINTKVLLIEIYQRKGIDQSGLRPSLLNLVRSIPNAANNFKYLIAQMSEEPFTNMEILKPAVIKVLRASNEVLFTFIAVMNLAQDTLNSIKDSPTRTQ